MPKKGLRAAYTMIIECPQCRNRYLVPDAAIGPDGRTVRCANCRHSWFAIGVATASEPVPEPAPAVAPPPMEAPPPPRTEPSRPEPIAAAPPQAQIDAFAHEPPFRPRRNPATRWTLIAACTGLLLVACIIAILWLDTPTLAGQFGIGADTAVSPLRIVEYPIERRDQANGSELFAISGRIVNPTNQPQRVPNLRAELRDASDRIVFNWVVRPGTRTLPPRSAVPFDSAQLDVPPNASKLVLSFSGAAER